MPVKINSDKKNGQEDVYGNTLKNIYAPKTPRVPFHYVPNLYGGYRKNFTQRGLLGGVTYNMLRMLARRSGILSSILARRTMQFTRISHRYKRDGDVGFKVCHEEEWNPGFIVPEEFKKYSEMLTKMFEYPFPEPTKIVEPNMASFATKWIRSLLVINRPAIELILNRRRQPVQFSMIDGANIYPTFDIIRQYMWKQGQKIATPMDFLLNTGAYKDTIQQYAESERVDIDERTEYIYIVDGRPLTGYRWDELLLMPIQSSDEYDDVGFPPSQTELALAYVVGEVMAQAWNLKWFDTGAVLDTILAFTGHFQDEDMIDFAEIIRQNHTGLSGAHGVPLINMQPGSDVKAVNIKAARTDMSFDNYLSYIVSGICNIFGMPPEEINYAGRARSDNSTLFGDKGKEIREQKEEGLLAACQHFKNTMDVIVKRHHPLLCFEWIGLDNSAEDRRRKKITEDKDILSIRERRVRLGMVPVPDNMTDEDVDIFENQIWASRKAAGEMQEQQEKMREHQQSMASISQGSVPEQGGEPEGEPEEGVYPEGEEEE